MPPLPSQKGTGKKNRDARQSRSRNSTPSLVGANTSSSLSQAESGSTPFLELPQSGFPIVDDISDIGSAIPSSKDLEALADRLEKAANVTDIRYSTCHKGMSELAKLRKERQKEIEDEDVREQARRAAEAEGLAQIQKAQGKKRKGPDDDKVAKDRPKAKGAHGLAPQDGTGAGTKAARPRSSPTPGKNRDRHREDRDDTASSSLSPPAPGTPATTGMEIDAKDEEQSSEDEHQPPPAPKIPHHQTFGDDPLNFPDPTRYHIPPITDDMDVDMKKDIFSVEVFPKSDLADLIAGDPPDKDFSNAKPTNQVMASTFQTYIDPYFRGFTEEDLAFLRERGDRSIPFDIPARGPHYSETWADADSTAIDPRYNRDKRPANQARGNFDNLDDAEAETDSISAGPVLSRLLATLRPEHRAPAAEEKPSLNGLNGDAGMTGETNGDFADAMQISSDTMAPATYMIESASDSWKKATHPKLDHAQVDERIKQELRFLGILPPEPVEPEYDQHADDEIAVRLRSLQAELREQSVMNGARKARLQDLVRERMAHQEYTTILEDLDGQVQQAYLKRTRTMGKNKKNKRPGGAGGGSHVVGSGTNGVARPGIPDLTKTIMERRKKWIESVGPVFDDERSTVKVPRVSQPGSSIMKPGDMAAYITREKEMWEEEAEEE